MDKGLIWILAGIALLGAEILLPGVWFLWIGLAAIGTGLLLLVAAPGFGVAVAVFLALLALGIGISLRLKPRRGPAHRVNAPEAGLAGRQATVVAIDGASLRVRLGDSDWPARLPHGAAMPPAGSHVRVEAVHGTVLVVRPEAPERQAAGFDTATLFANWTPAPPYPPAGFVAALRSLFAEAQRDIMPEGPPPDEAQVRAALRELVLRINALNAEHGEPIETDERESLAAAIERLATAAGHHAAAAPALEERLW